MKQKKLISIIVVILIIVGIASYLILIKNTTPKNQIKIPPQQVLLPQKEAPVKYINTEYGFTFTLPTSWEGYTILKTKWNGNVIDDPSAKNVTGPEILIRNPQWTIDVPKQDIPIMIFTMDEWNQVQQEKLSLGAAPIPPSELGRNKKYVFALPARYNFAFPVGFEEVDIIIKGNPLSTF